MTKRFVQNRTAVITTLLVLIIACIGIFAPVFAPNDPYETNIINKFAEYSIQYPLGTDQLGRCVLSRMIYGIRPTLGLAVLTMLGTIGIGAILGIMAGYFRGIVEEIIMRVVDVMLSFPSQIMVFAVVALLGVSVQNVIIANVFIKWAWYARMIRTGVMQYRDKNLSSFPDALVCQSDLSCSGICSPRSPQIWQFWLLWISDGRSLTFQHFLFWGLVFRHLHQSGGAMLNEAKEVLTSNPTQMIAPGIAIVALVCCFNLMGDALRDVLDPKEVER